MKRTEIIPPGDVLPPMTPDSVAPPEGTAGTPIETASGADHLAEPRVPTPPRKRVAAGRSRNHADRFNTLNVFVDSILRGLPPRDALAWLVLYRDTKPDGFARTGFTDLARRLGCSVRTAMRVVKRLRRRRLVERVRKGAPGSGPNTYKILVTPLPVGDEPPAPPAAQ